MMKMALCFLERGIKPESSYNYFDTEKEDVIDANQYERGLKSLSIFLNRIEINELFGAIDNNNSGCITAEEYYIFIETKFNNLQKIIKNERSSFTGQVPIQVIRSLHSSIMSRALDLRLRKIYLIARGIRTTK